MTDRTPRQQPVASDLVERLRKKAVYTDEAFDNRSLGDLYREAATALSASAADQPEAGLVASDFPPQVYPDSEGGLPREFMGFAALIKDNPPMEQRSVSVRMIVAVADALASREAEIASLKREMAEVERLRALLSQIGTACAIADMKDDLPDDISGELYSRCIRAGLGVNEEEYQVRARQPSPPITAGGEGDLVVRFLDPGIGSLIDDGTLNPATSGRYAQSAERAAELLAALGTPRQQPAEVSDLVERLPGLLRALAVDCTLTDGWQDAAPDLTEAADALASQAAEIAEARRLLERWQIWACGQQGVSPFQDARAFLATNHGGSDATD